MKRLLIEILMAGLLVLATMIAVDEHKRAEQNDAVARELAADVEQQRQALERGREIVYRLAHQISLDGTAACEQREF